MIIRYSPIAITEIQRFNVDKTISNFVEFETNIDVEIENAYNLTQKGVKTDTPLLPQWDGKYKQLYCKHSGWFFAYKPIHGGIRICHAVHQSEMKDTKGEAQDVTMNPNQDKSNLSSSAWTYVRDAHYGFGIVRNAMGQYNYADFNGDLLLTDKEGEPVWFDNISPFNEGLFEELRAYGIKDGYLVFFKSNGEYSITNTLASKYGYTNTSVLEKRKAIDAIISEVLNRYLGKELLRA